MKSFYDDPRQEGRFEVLNDKEVNLDPKKNYYMYWLEDNPASMLIGRKMLEASGYEVYALWDTAKHPEPQYCLLTDYAHKWN
jgi:hypothetical protein